jgi:hypothetical protein
MHPISTLGTRVDLLELAGDLKRRMMARGLDSGRAFTSFADQIVCDHPDQKALVLTGGAVVEGDLEVDFDALAKEGISTVAVLGDCEVHGRLINNDGDGRPFFFVDGDLRTRAIEKGGASFIVLGSVKSDGLVFCDRDNGVFLVGGDLSAPAIISCDQDIIVSGATRGRVVSSELGNMRDALVPEVFTDPSDPADEFADGGLIRKRIAAGQRVLKAG